MRRDWDWPKTTRCAWLSLIWCSEGRCGRESKKGLILLANIDIEESCLCYSNGNAGRALWFNKNVRVAMVVALSLLI